MAQIEIIRTLAKDKEIDVNSQNESSQTALLLAANAARLTAVRVLLEVEADFQPQDVAVNSKYTPLFFAKKTWCVDNRVAKDEIVKLLEEKQKDWAARQNPSP